MNAQETLLSHFMKKTEPASMSTTTTITTINNTTSQMETTTATTVDSEDTPTSIPNKTWKFRVQNWPCLCIWTPRPMTTANVRFVVWHLMDINGLGWNQTVVRRRLQLNKQNRFEVFTHSEELREEVISLLKQTCKSWHIRHHHQVEKRLRRPISKKPHSMVDSQS